MNETDILYQTKQYVNSTYGKSPPYAPNQPTRKEQLDQLLNRNSIEALAKKIQDLEVKYLLQKLASKLDLLDQSDMVFVVGCYRLLSGHPEAKLADTDKQRLEFLLKQIS